ncbi:hypothetical protein F4806DRAFT_107101 [Annulohypoxylon nitens]|nr:hypothetical protein F4806DRAFT_107101 [Annulohypoxylon nitens]
MEYSKGIIVIIICKYIHTYIIWVTPYGGNRALRLGLILGGLAGLGGRLGRSAGTAMQYRD